MRVFLNLFLQNIDVAKDELKNSLHGRARNNQMNIKFLQNQFGKVYPKKLYPKRYALFTVVEKI